MIYLKKLFAILAAAALAVCLSLPVFATDTAESVPDTSSSETTDSTDTSADESTGKDMLDKTTDSVDSLTNAMNGVKEKWDELFGVIGGVLEFTTTCVGGAISVLPTSFTVYFVMLCVCISVIGIVKVISRGWND